jgi:hypothetical protein
MMNLQTTYAEHVKKLSRMSVVKSHDAYADIDWDAPENVIDPEDRAWELDDDDPLGATAWYKQQPQPVRARIGLHIAADAMAVGREFEGLLKRGLLSMVLDKRTDPVERRYLYHEIIEEAQHSLMFSEFVSRVQTLGGFESHGIPARLYKHATPRIVKLASWFPELFFIFVLGGEDPIDHVQRRYLSSGRPLHPLLKRIMHIHVTEEARHVSFARGYLEQRVRHLSPARRAAMAVVAPVSLGIMANLILLPSMGVLRDHQVPKVVQAEVARRNRPRAAASLAKVRGLCDQLGLITPRTEILWKRMGINQKQM